MIWKRALRTSLFVLGIACAGGIAGVFFDRALLPRLAAMPALEGLSFLKQATSNTTIINRTEQIVIREDDTVEKIASQAASAVVSIVSIADQDGRARTPETRVGSGALLTNDGLIATYRTAILETEAVYTVLLYNGQTYPAVLSGVDPLTNLAYLKVSAGNLPALALANSDDSRPGKRLIALANSPQEYQNRFSTGLLSNINKTFNLSGQTVASTEKWEGVFETDFSGSPDFLGGPVIGFNGEMVGLVGSVVMDNQTRFFLIPSNAVRESLTLAIRGELKQRPVFGASYLPITKTYALAQGLSRDRGALIFSPGGQAGLAIIAGSPAARAGLQAGDIVIAVNGQEINLSLPLSVALGRLKQGETATLLIIRDGAERTLPVTL